MNILADPKKQFFAALIISTGLHLFLVMVLPGLPMGDFNVKQKYAEIKLVYIPPKPAKAIKKSNKRPKAKTPLAEEGNILTEQINKLSKTTHFQGTIPTVTLPAEVPEQELSGLLPEVEFPLEDIILPAGSPLTTTPEPKTKSDPFPLLGITGAKHPRPNSPIGIEWAGPPRRPVFQPPIPQYSSKIEGDVRLKFWVDPAGKVSNVVVVQKLDAYLERISLQYMKQWVFEPLAPNLEQNFQWGTITIQFRRD